MRRVLRYITTVMILLSMTTTAVVAQDGAVQSTTPLEKAIMAVGGEAALQTLSTVTVQATGVRWVLDEGYEPGGDPVRIGAYTTTVTIDLTVGNLRVEQTKETLGQARDLTEVIVGDVGYKDGLDGRFGAPGQSAMGSDRLVSTSKQQELLNPHGLLQVLLADSSLATDAGEVLLDGAIYHRLEVPYDPAPLTLYIHAGTGQLLKISTTEEMPLRRDVSLELYYYNWQPVDESGLAFPAEVYIVQDGEVVAKEVRSAVAVNPEVDAALFTIPDEVATPYDEALAARGSANHNYLQMFAHYGFVRDGIQTNVVANEIAPGIYHLTGGSHNSMAVEQDEGIVIVETPLGGYRSELIMEWTAETFPEKPITAAVVTHHHEDHAAGLREFAAAGATAIVHETAAAFFAHIFDAPATVAPDGMSDVAGDWTMETVPADGSFELSDSMHPIEIYPLAQTHAEDMVIVYVADPGVVFVTDIYSPNPDADSAGAGGQLIADAIDALGLDVAWIVGGHGGAISFADFQAQLE